MLYVSGKVKKQVGPFEAYLEFAGFVSEVIQMEDHVVIQGIRVERKHVTQIARVRDTHPANLNLPKLVGADSPEPKKEDIRITIMNDVSRQLYNELQNAIKQARRYKRIINADLVTSYVDESMKQKATAARRVHQGDTSGYLAAMKELRRFYKLAMDTVGDARTAKQLEKELRCMFSR